MRLPGPMRPGRALGAGGARRHSGAPVLLGSTATWGIGVPLAAGAARPTRPRGQTVAGAQWVAVECSGAGLQLCLWARVGGGGVHGGGSLCHEARKYRRELCRRVCISKQCCGCLLPWPRRCVHSPGPHIWYPAGLRLFCFSRWALGMLGRLPCGGWGDSWCLRCLSDPVRCLRLSRVRPAGTPSGHALGLLLWSMVGLSLSLLGRTWST